MPVEISNTQNSKPVFGEGFKTGLNDPRRLLHSLAVNVQDKSGSIKLMHTTDPEQNMAFERKSWWQFGTRGHDKMKNTADYVSALLRESYQPLIDKMPPGLERDVKQRKLDQVLQEFGDHVANKDYQFGKNTMRSFFNWAEREFVHPDSRLKINPSGKQADFKPLVGDQPQKLQKQAVDQKPVKKEVSFADPNSFVIQKNDFPQEKIVQQQVEKPQIQKLAKFEPKIHSSVEDFFKTHTTGAKVKRLGSGSFGTAYLVNRDHGHPACLKLLKDGTKNNFLLSRRGNLRDFDVSSVYLNSEKGLKIPHVARPKALLIEVLDNNGEKQFHYVPMENSKEAKKYIRDLATQNLKAYVVGVEMPMAKGKPLDKCPLKGPQNSEDRKAIGKQLMEYVHASHQRGIIDRDHKPENLFYDQPSKKLTKIDLGMQIKLSSNPKKQNITNAFCGSPYYLCPKKSGPYGPEADLYEAGIGLLEIKYGEDFLDLARQRFEAIKNPPFNQALGATKGQENIDFVKYRNQPANQNKSYLQCLVEFSSKKTKNPDERAVADKILADLRENDPETKFLEQLFETATKSKVGSDTSQGRKTLFKDYYTRLDELMKHEWVK